MQLLAGLGEQLFLQEDKEGLCDRIDAGP